MLEYFKMPQPLTVIGCFYILVAICVIVDAIKCGYWRGIWSESKRQVNIANSMIFLVSILLLVLYLDLPVSLLASRYYNQDFYTVVDFFNSVGEGWFIGGVALTLGLCFKICLRRNLAIVSQISLLSSLYAGLFNTVAKIIFNRERPSMGMHPEHFFNFLLNNDRHFADLFYASNSMPSGHTITIFAAIMPYFCYSKNIVVKTSLMMICGSICFARLYTLNHWLSDVCVSATLGVIIGLSCYRCNQHRLVRNHGEI